MHLLNFTDHDDNDYNTMMKRKKKKKCEVDPGFIDRSRAQLSLVPPTLCAGFGVNSYVAMHR